MTRAVTGVNWKSYGLSQPRGSLPVGPLVVLVHLASVWVPFTSESKDAIASYGEIIEELTRGLQECGRRLATFLRKRQREKEAARKRNYIELYIPHLAHGLKEILDLNNREETRIVDQLKKTLGKSRLDT